MEGSEKAVGHGSVEMGEPEGQVESGRMRIEGDRKLLVAGKAPEIYSWR